MHTIRGARVLHAAVLFAVLAVASGQFFVNLGDKTKAAGTDVDTATAPGGVAPAAEGDLAAQADPNVKLQVFPKPLVEMLVGL